MTTCRFCAKVVVSNPQTLKSVEDPSIQSFLAETTIVSFFYGQLIFKFN